ncbi:MAG: SDR family oxidoreductase [Candidatus Omnitrophica bacterium]|nr:SDR family oxidoreductase [Candidatus Omnitrophota bacterium]
MKIKTIVIVGANGFMGNKLVAEALLKGIRVIAFARKNNEESAEKRVLLELEENLNADQLANLKNSLTVYDYDINKSDLGLSSDVIKTINETADAVFNFVGDTNFFPKDIKQSFRTNVEGPIHLIETLCNGKAVFNHVSTAYVSGSRDGVIYEAQLDEGQAFKNDYEQNKFLGEKKVHEVCAQKGIRYNIFRPSIVIRKHSVHGKSPNLNHFYSFVGLIDIVRQDAQTVTQSSSKDTLEIPIRFLGLRKSTLNFVDLDYATQAILEIALTVQNENRTYHLVNHNPMTNQEFINTMMKLYNIKGFSIIEDKKDLTNLNFRERLVKRGLANYISYFFVNPQFDDSSTQNAVREAKISCPNFDSHYIARATGHFS